MSILAACETAGDRSCQEVQQHSQPLPIGAQMGTVTAKPGYSVERRVRKGSGIAGPRDTAGCRVSGVIIIIVTILALYFKVTL